VDLSSLNYFSSNPLKTLRCAQVEDHDLVDNVFAIDPAAEQRNLAAVRHAIVAHRGTLQQLTVEVLSSQWEHILNERPYARSFDPTNWRRVLEPWEEITELGREEGIEVLLRPWR
jgi:hypothetical protein